MRRISNLFQAAVGRVFPAAQLVVVDGFETVFDTHVGNCDRDTLFDVASLTKALATTTLAMRFLEAGKLSLDNEVRPGISVGLALCHATGLPAWKLLGQGARDEIIERVRGGALGPPPGTASVYSDLGFILLGDLLERIGGAPLDQLFRAQVAPGLEIGY